jgi:hypothetical protein
VEGGELQLARHTFLSLLLANCRSLHCFDMALASGHSGESRYDEKGNSGRNL